MVNQEIKDLIKKHRLFRYEVADAMGISEGYLSTLLRKPLTEEMEQKVLDAVKKLSNQQEENSMERVVNNMEK